MSTTEGDTDTKRQDPPAIRTIPPSDPYRHRSRTNPKHVRRLAEFVLTILSALQQSRMPYRDVGRTKTVLVTFGDLHCISRIAAHMPKCR